MDPASGTEKPLPELKNTLSKKYLKNQNLGLTAELKVIRYLEALNWKILGHRMKTSVAEVDIVIQKNKEIRLIEVKSLDNPWRVFQRISPRQVQKLLLNQIFFINSYSGFEVSAYVAWVGSRKNLANSNNEIKFVKVN